MDRFELALEGVLEAGLDGTVVDYVVIIRIVDHLVGYVVIIRIVDHLVGYVVDLRNVVVRSLFRLLGGLGSRLGWCIAGRL